MTRSDIPRVTVIKAAYGIALALPAPAFVAAQEQNPPGQSEPNQPQEPEGRDSQAQSRSSRTNPYAQADGSWISISGTVEDVRANAFTLNYGDGTITVEMDDADRDAEAYALTTGDEVRVLGSVDDDLFETTSIEAGSIYIPKTSTYFFASSLDEEDLYAFKMPVRRFDPTSDSVMGRVVEVGAGDFTIDAGTDDIRVDVEQMDYNPLDHEGYQQIEVGDFVSVEGEIDTDFFAGRELEASAVITMFEEVG